MKKKIGHDESRKLCESDETMRVRLGFVANNNHFRQKVPISFPRITLALSSHLFIYFILKKSFFYTQREYF